MSNVCFIIQETDKREIDDNAVSYNVANNNDLTLYNIISPFCPATVRSMFLMYLGMDIKSLCIYTDSISTRCTIPP